MFDPIKIVTNIPEEVRTLISDGKLEGQIAVLDLVLAAEQVGAKAAQDFLQAKINELKSELKPL